MTLKETRSSYQAAFALDVITAAIALVFLILATGPFFKRIKARRFSVPGKDRPAPLKTSLGTYLFLWPALLLFTTIYILTFVVDLLKATGTINSSILSLIISFLSILFTVLLNGSVWIYSNHTCANGTGRAAPSWKSRVQNTVEMLAILTTGIAIIGYGVSVRARTSSWATTVAEDRTTRIVYILYRAVVVAATLSVSIEVLMKHFQIRANSSKDSSDRANLTRFAMVVVPLIWVRNAFTIYDILLLYVNTAAWNRASTLASEFLLIVFSQFANLTIAGMVLLGAWRTGKTVADGSDGNERLVRN